MIIYYILGLIFVSQVFIYHTILKKRKQHIPSVNYSTENPTIYHIPIWSIGDLWINYETLTCFMLASKGLNRYWKVIGSTSIKYTDAQRKDLEDPKLVAQHKKDFGGER